MPRTAILAMIALLAGVGPGAVANASAAELDVVASFSIIADFSSRVGGERIALTTLVGRGSDAHVYEPKPADAVAVGEADLVLVNGLQFEGFLARLVEASATKARIVEVAKGADLIEQGEGAHDHHHGAHAPGETNHAPENHAEAGHEHATVDPHAWQSVPNAEVYVRNIAEAFCGADPAGCDIYEANAGSYIAELRTLDAEIRAAVRSIPENRRTVITSHRAFGYFGHEYGLTFLAPEGVSTESEASAADIAALITQVKEDRASAIFLENVTNPRLMEQIAKETGLSLGGSLYSDALSAEDGPAATYLGMMRTNIEAIRSAVAGS